jgi:hypothetical protein
MGNFTMTKQCVLIQHGLLWNNGLIGTCCYNPTNPENYSDYNIDPIGCSACIDQENNNVKSYRQGANEKYGLLHNHRNPIVLDFTPNVNCNLTCKICNEHSSSSWAKLKQIKFYKNHNISTGQFKSVFESVDLSNVEEINFSGGEPLLNNNILKYLSTLENRIDFSKCTLRFSTNTTVPLTTKISKFFLKFKLVLARFSIDDVEAGFEYQRYPAKWAQCQHNWQLFLDTMPHNVIPSINRTVSILNIRRLDLLEQWHSSYVQTRFSDPIELIDHFAGGDYSLTHMPLALKEDIRLNGPMCAWNYVKSREPGDTTVLQTTIQQHDMMHNTMLEKFDPELYRFIFQ